MIRLRAWWALLWIELRGLTRARVTLFWVFVFPLVFLSMMMITYGKDGGIGAFSVSIRDQDGTPASRDLVSAVDVGLRSLKSVQSRVIEEEPGTPIKESGITVVIDKGFANALAARQPATLSVSASSRDAWAPLAQRLIQSIAEEHVRRQSDQPSALVIRQVARDGDPRFNYRLYLLTGVILMAMMSAGMANTAVSVVERRERNSFKMMACMPVSASDYLLALITARVVLLVVASLAVLLVGRLAFDIAVPLDAATLWTASLILALSAVMLLSLGVVLGSRMTSVPNALFVTNFVYLALLFMSDLTVPLRSLPGGIKTTLSHLPTSTAVEALRAVFINGATLISQLPALLTLVAWTVTFALLSRALFVWHKS